MRERLIELLRQADEDAANKVFTDYEEAIAAIADYLLANGVIVPPCKVGDTVYVIYNGYVTSAKVLAMYIDLDGGMFDLQIKTKDETTVGFKTVIDKDNYTFDNVFLTREEAEAALKERFLRRII